MYRTELEVKRKEVQVCFASLSLYLYLELHTITSQFAISDKLIIHSLTKLGKPPLLFFI